MLKGHKASKETRAKMSAAAMQRPLSPDRLQPVPTRLRPDQIEALSLIEGESSIILRAAVDLFLKMTHIADYSAEQTAAIAEYEKIGNQFPVGAIFVFNPKTLGGNFFYYGRRTVIANPEELAAAWDAHKPKRPEPVTKKK